MESPESSRSDIPFIQPSSRLGIRGGRHLTRDEVNQLGLASRSHRRFVGYDHPLAGTPVSQDTPTAPAFPTTVPEITSPVLPDSSFIEPHPLLTRIRRLFDDNSTNSMESIEHALTILEALQARKINLFQGILPVYIGEEVNHILEDLGSRIEWLRQRRRNKMMKAYVQDSSTDIPNEWGMKSRGRPRTNQAKQSGDLSSDNSPGQQMSGNENHQPRLKRHSKSSQFREAFHQLTPGVCIEYTVAPEKAKAGLIESERALWHQVARREGLRIQTLTRKDPESGQVVIYIRKIA